MILRPIALLALLVMASGATAQNSFGDTSSGGFGQAPVMPQGGFQGQQGGFNGQQQGGFQGQQGGFNGQQQGGFQGQQGGSNGQQQGGFQGQQGGFNGQQQGGFQGQQGGFSGQQQGGFQGQQGGFNGQQQGGFQGQQGGFNGQQQGGFQGQQGGFNGQQQGGFQGQQQVNALDQLAQFERQDLGIPATQQLHGGPMHGATPASIPGGQVITTKGLVDLIQGQQTPYLLFDVLGGQVMLPGAIPAVQASTPGSFNDQIQQQMGQYLQQATQGNPQVPLIFYCASIECWMSYNAALRAINLGYTNVLWYRGGIAAWQQAGGPTMPAGGGMGGGQQPQRQ